MSNPPQLNTNSTGFVNRLFSPKAPKTISFPSSNEQPNQQNRPTKRLGLEAYAKKNKQSLPSGFSDQILECEMDLAKDDVSMDTINKLTDLYTQAMSFYESEGNHKYKYFATKLQDLMMLPNVKATMVQEMAPSQPGQDPNTIEIQRLRFQNQISKINAEKEAFTIVESQQTKVKQLNKVLEANLTGQKDRLKKKLAERKARNQARSQSMTSFNDDASSTTEETPQDIDKELFETPIKLKFDDDLGRIDEVDEAGYNTPPRRRNKDGTITFFRKGKNAWKPIELKGIEDSENERKIKRKYSFDKEKAAVTLTLPQRRHGRALSFGDKKALPLIGLTNLRLLNKPQDQADQETEAKVVEQDKIIETNNEVIFPEIIRQTEKEVMITKESPKKIVENGAISVEEVPKEIVSENISNEEQESEVLLEHKVHTIEHQEFEAPQNQVDEKEVLVDDCTEFEPSAHNEATTQKEEDKEEAHINAEASEVLEQKPDQEHEKEVVVDDCTEFEPIHNDTPIQKDEEEEKIVINEAASENLEQNLDQEQEKEVIVDDCTEFESSTNNEAPIQKSEDKDEVHISDAAPENLEQNFDPVFEKEVIVDDCAELEPFTEPTQKDEDHEKTLNNEEVVEDSEKKFDEFRAEQEFIKQNAITAVKEKYSRKIKAMEDDTDPEEREGVMWQKMITKIQKDEESELKKIEEEHVDVLEKFKSNL